MNPPLQHAWCPVHVYPDLFIQLPELKSMLQVVCVDIDVYHLLFS